MKYREFGRSGWKVSALGFGAMRMPTTDNKPSSPNIIENEAIAMIRRAIDAGVNYVDTAYIYHGGKSEELVGKALKDGYRARTRVATKSPIWLLKQPNDFDKILDEQLKRLEMPYVDYYLLHGLDIKTWKNSVLGMGLLDHAERAQAEGKIHHIGFSFHDKFEAFKEILDGYNKWEFCQIQYNFLDTENQAGTAGLRLAASRGLPVVIMEPLLGGKLARPPQSVQDILKSSGWTRPASDLALRWIWDQPEVSVVLSGMSTMEQVNGNIASAEASGPDSLTEEEVRLVKILQVNYREKIPLQCTECRYCLPCPNGVDIPRNLMTYINAIVHEDLNQARTVYTTFIPEKERASACIGCGECEEKCPQKLKISELMPKVHGMLSPPKT